MTQEFEGDLTGAVFWGADMRGARFRDCDLTGARVDHVYLVDVEIDALVDRLVVNGVDVTDFVNERDPWHPLRSMVEYARWNDVERIPNESLRRAASPEGMRETWAALEAEWAATIARAQALPEGAVHRSVDGEWSFVQTLRHLVFAMDKWFAAPVVDGGFHPIGMPNSGSVDFPWPDLDPALDPSLDEVLAVREERAGRFRDFLAALAAADLDRSVEVLENGPNPVRECIATVFEEELAHQRYARRDLGVLEAS